MASICRDPGGLKRITFTGKGGKRWAIRLGKKGIKYAQSIAARVEELAACSLANLPWGADLATWVRDIDSGLYAKLQAVELVPPRQDDCRATVSTLGEYLKSYIASRTDVKPRTRINLEQARQHLIRFFGEDRSLDAITLGDADEFRRDLFARLSANTARRHCGRAKQFFRLRFARN